MNTLLALSIAIAAGLAVSRLARLVRLPNVTAFLVGGLIIGPSVLGILPRDMLGRLLRHYGSRVGLHRLFHRCRIQDELSQAHRRQASDHHGL